jgi:hypothetical protein
MPHFIVAINKKKNDDIKNINHDKNPKRFFVLVHKKPYPCDY